MFVQDLPADIRKRFMKTVKTTKKEVLPRMIRQEEGRWPEFAVAVTKFAASKQPGTRAWGRISTWSCWYIRSPR